MLNNTISRVISTEDARYNLIANSPWQEQAAPESISTQPVLVALVVAIALFAGLVAVFAVLMLVGHGMKKTLALVGQGEGRTAPDYSGLFEGMD
jgi:hypothetical protein